MKSSRATTQARLGNSSASQKLILWTSRWLGDNVVLSGAVRDLHRCHPQQFETDVRTDCREWWHNNPYLRSWSELDPAVQVVDCHGPFLPRTIVPTGQGSEGLYARLNEHLGTRITPSLPRGDVHLSLPEQAPGLLVSNLRTDFPYWLLMAGGDYDRTVSWWHFRRFQAVVDHFKGRLLFIQVGRRGDYHPPLEDVVCLCGKTTLRQLLRLVYWADGLLCSAGVMPDLAASVATSPGRSSARPCVVVAGGYRASDPYSHHQFIHTVGTLPCCAQEPCRYSRTLPLGDGRDHVDQLCVDVVNGLPRCTDMIQAEDVIRRIEWFLENGMSRQLTHNQAQRSRAHLRPSHREQLLRRSVERRRDTSRLPAR